MSPSIWQVLILLLIIILLFGTSKLKNVGSDLGSALKGFKKAVKDDDKDAADDNKDADFESLSKPSEKTDAPNISDAIKTASPKSTDKE